VLFGTAGVSAMFHQDAVMGGAGGDDPGQRVRAEQNRHDGRGLAEDLDAAGGEPVA